MNAGCCPADPPFQMSRPVPLSRPSFSASRPPLPAVLLSAVKSDNSAFGRSMLGWDGRGGVLLLLLLLLFNPQEEGGGGSVVGGIIALAESPSLGFYSQRFSRPQADYQQTAFSEFPQNSHTHTHNSCKSPASLLKTHQSCVCFL